MLAHDNKKARTGVPVRASRKGFPWWESTAIALGRLGQQDLGLGAVATAIALVAGFLSVGDPVQSPNLPLRESHAPKFGIGSGGHGCRRHDGCRFLLQHANGAIGGGFIGHECHGQNANQIHTSSLLNRMAECRAGMVSVPEFLSGSRGENLRSGLWSPRKPSSSESKTRTCNLGVIRFGGPRTRQISMNRLYSAPLYH